MYAKFTNREEVDFKNHEVETHRQSDGAKQPLVAVRRHYEQRLVLRDATTCTRYDTIKTMTCTAKTTGRHPLRQFTSPP